MTTPNRDRLRDLLLMFVLVVAWVAHAAIVRQEALEEGKAAGVETCTASLRT